MFEHIFDRVRETAPFVHNITNYVTAGDCANMILACGASPIMADDPAEAAEITALCGALVINIGTLNERTIPSMFAAGREAGERGIPVILDPVGAGASRLRTETALRLLEEIRFQVIRGNASEIRTLLHGGGRTNGVDVNEADRITEGSVAQALTTARKLSERTGAVVAVTGEIDVVTYGENSFLIRNGHPMMSRITGTGCMLTAVIGSLCAANPDRILEATTAGVAAMGICGELAYGKIAKSQEGTAAFRIYLMDAMSFMEDELLKQRGLIQGFFKQSLYADEAADGGFI